MSIKITPVKVWRRNKSLGSKIGKKGIIESFTIVHTAPSGYSQYAPFPVAIVRLSSGARLIGQVVDFDDVSLKIGTKVVTVIRRQRTEGKKEVIPYVIKFRPL